MSVEIDIANAIASKLRKKGKEVRMSGKELVVSDGVGTITPQKPKYIRSGHKAPDPIKIKSPRPQQSWTKSNGDEILKAIKEWAKKNGYEVKVK